MNFTQLFNFSVMYLYFYSSVMWLYDLDFAPKLHYTQDFYQLSIFYVIRFFSSKPTLESDK